MRGPPILSPVGAALVRLANRRPHRVAAANRSGPEPLRLAPGHTSPCSEVLLLHLCGSCGVFACSVQSGAIAFSASAVMDSREAGIDPTSSWLWRWWCALRRTDWRMTPGDSSLIRR